MADFSPKDTRRYELPPWEVAKAFAFHKVIEQMEEETGMSAPELLGKGATEFIATQVVTKDNEAPSLRTLQKTFVKCKDPAWYPGKVVDRGAGRPPEYSEHVKEEVARVAMDLKRTLQRPTPRNVRARLPNLTKNPETGQHMDDKTIQAIFSTRCYDETEDDPWAWLGTLSQDFLPSEMKPKRVTCGKHLQKVLTPQS